MQIIGIDPDLHSTALALVEIEVGKPPKVEAVSIIHVHRKIVGAAAVVAMCRSACVPFGHLLPRPAQVAVVEGQDFTGRGKADPMNIIRLGTVAGAFLHAVQAFEIRFPRAVEWKGSVPKNIHQARTLTTLGIETAYVDLGPKKGCRPTATGYFGWGADEIANAEWTHILDAVGLALWGAKEHLLRTEIAKHAPAG